MLTEELRQVIREELAAVQLPKVPVTLKEAAEVCRCEYRWLLERVQAQEIRAFRPPGAGTRTPWRVYVSEVIKFMTGECNIKPARLRRVA